MASGSSRFETHPLCTRWGDNHHYPLTTRCYGFEPEVSPPAPLVQMRHYALLSQPLGRSRASRESSVPPRMQRFVTTKNNCWERRGGRPS